MRNTPVAVIVVVTLLLFSSLLFSSLFSALVLAEDETLSNVDSTIEQLQAGAEDATLTAAPSREIFQNKTVVQRTGRMELLLPDTPPPAEIRNDFIRRLTRDGETPLLSPRNQLLVEDLETRRQSIAILKEFEAAQDDSTMAALRILGKHDVDRYMVVFNSSCLVDGIPEMAIKRNILTDKYRFMVLRMPKPMLASLVENDCVYKIADRENEEQFFAYAKRILLEERKERTKQMNLDGSSHDLENYQELQDSLEKEWDTAAGRHSPLQQYVTPADSSIVNDAVGKSPEELYLKALSWPWMSDPAFWNETDRWLAPGSFIRETPGKTGNPAPSTPVSDCEEHANTLVALLRASGIPSKDVRVAIGNVEFEDGSVGGHAWAELRMNGTWIVLDGTVGPYVDDETRTLHQREGLPYVYWKYHEFPVRDVWAYYNDQHFLDMRYQKAPSTWGQDAGTLFDKEMGDAMRPSLWERIILFLLKIVGKFA